MKKRNATRLKRKATKGVATLATSAKKVRRALRKAESGLPMLVTSRMTKYVRPAIAVLGTGLLATGAGVMRGGWRRRRSSSSNVLAIAAGAVVGVLALGAWLSPSIRKSLQAGAQRAEAALGSHIKHLNNAANETAEMRSAHT